MWIPSGQPNLTTAAIETFFRNVGTLALPSGGTRVMNRHARINRRKDKQNDEDQHRSHPERSHSRRRCGTGRERRAGTGRRDEEGHQPEGRAKGQESSKKTGRKEGSQARQQARREDGGEARQQKGRQSRRSQAGK